VREVEDVDVVADVPLGLDARRLARFAELERAGGVAAKVECALIRGGEVPLAGLLEVEVSEVASAFISKSDERSSLDKTILCTRSGLLDLGE